MDKRFLTAFLAPPSRKVGGFVLDAFCLRHSIVLEAIESPFFTGQKMPSVNDIIIVLKVLSTKDVRDISKVTLWDRIKFARITYDLKYQAEVTAELQHFLKESLSIPKIWNKQNAGEVSQKKEPMNRAVILAAALISKFGFSEEEAWNMPICKAIWYITAYALLEGVDIQTISTSEEESEEADKKKIKEMEEKAVIETMRSFKMKVKQA